MPTYEYECMKCGHRFEKLQGMKEKPLKKCPQCGGRIKRLIGTGVSVIFKGNGFYHTDYKMKVQKKEDIKKDKKENKKEEKKEEKKGTGE